jgi:hypothetical protein
MTDAVKPDRPALPRDSFRTQRISSEPSPGPKPVIVTPDYDDRAGKEASALVASQQLRDREPHALSPPKSPPPKRPLARNPFDAYGERTSSRPYSLRLPDPIDLALRQLAAEERTHPLRIIDRILHDHLKRIGRLPPTGRA